MDSKTAEFMSWGKYHLDAKGTILTEDDIDHKHIPIASSYYYNTITGRSQSDPWVEYVDASNADQQVTYFFHLETQQYWMMGKDPGSGNT